MALDGRLLRFQWQEWFLILKVLNIFCCLSWNSPRKVWMLLNKLALVIIGPIYQESVP